MSAPLVSVGIPLYRSARFFGVIAGNIEAADYPNLEIIVSDRHMIDDTLERLADRFADDVRVRFVRARDGVHWVEHYNLLLREARGRYFCWMPHDDSFPGHWISALVSCLEHDPEIILACGRLRPLVLEKAGYRRKSNLIAAPETAPPRSMSGVRALLHDGRLGVSMRGVFRRDQIVGRRLWIRNPRDGVRADIYWIFALALIGRLHAVDEVECAKRYYPGSTGRWHVTNRHVIDAFSVVAGYAHQLHGYGLRTAMIVWAALLWTLTRLWYRQPKKLQRLFGLAFKFARNPVHGVKRLREMRVEQVLWRLKGNVKVTKKKAPGSGDP